MAVITRLRTADRATCGQIGALVRMLSSRLKGCSPTLLRKILASPETELWVGKEGKTIAAMGTLALVLRPEGIAARIEDVVVDPRYQRQGLGEAISEKLIERAKARGAAGVSRNGSAIFSLKGLRSTADSTCRRNIRRFLPASSQRCVRWRTPNSRSPSSRNSWTIFPPATCEEW